MSKTVSKVLVILAGFLALGLLYSGCDNPFADDEDDGTLTVSVSGFNGDCGGDDVLFAAFVYSAGANVMADNVEPVAIVGEMVTGSSASGTAFRWGDGPGDPAWSGKGGNRYDVYPTIFCTDGTDDAGTPTVGGTPFYELDPDWVYRSAAYDQPVTYKQDGNKSIATAFSDYVVVP